MHHYRRPLMALAALAAAAPLHAAEFSVAPDTTLRIYGTVEPSFVTQTDENGDTGSQLTDNDSTLGFGGDRRLDEEYSAGFEAEFAWDADEDRGDNLNDFDHAWLRLQGPFGEARIGSYDTLFENGLSELLDAFENAELSEPADSDEGNQVTWFAPGYREEALSGAIELRYQGDGEEDGPPGESGLGVAGVLSYDAEDWGARVGLDNRGAAFADGATEFEDEPTFGLGGYYELDAFTFSGLAALENAPGGNDTTFLGVLGSYDYGPGSVNLGLQNVSPDQGSSRTELAANIKHDLYEDLHVFAEAGFFDKANDEDDRFEVGAIYSF